MKTRYYYFLRSFILKKFSIALLNSHSVVNKGFDCELLKFRYFACPKAGSSSIKSIIILLNEISKKKDGYQGFDIKSVRGHDILRNLKGHYLFQDGSDEFKNLIFIRDPVDRFISGFNDRVLFRDEANFSIGNHKTVEEKLDIFIKNLGLFVKINEAVRWHFLSQYSFYKPAIDSKIPLVKINLKDATDFFINQISELDLSANLSQELISAITFKKNASSSKKKIKNVKINRDTLTKNHLDYLYKYYKKDFQLFESI